MVALCWRTSNWSTTTSTKRTAKQAVALRLNRDSIFWLDAIGYLLIASGDWDRGAELIRRAVESTRFPGMSVTAGFGWTPSVATIRPQPSRRQGGFAPPNNFWSSPDVRSGIGVRQPIRWRLRGQTERLLEMKPDFPERGRWHITRYVKFDDLVERVEADLARAGLAVS